MAGVPEIARKAGVKQNDVRAMFAAVADLTAEGERVQVANFGSFSLRVQKERTVRSPKIPGGEATVPERNVIGFRMSKKLRNFWNDEGDDGGEEEDPAEEPEPEEKPKKGAAKGAAKGGAKKAAAEEPAPKKGAKGGKAKKEEPAEEQEEQEEEQEEEEPEEEPEEKPAPKKKKAAAAK
jgi:nucleoid DNA-binding protein